MGRQRPQIIVFDVDDTLYLERDYALSGFGAVGRWLEEHHALRGFAAIAGDLFAGGRRGDIFNRALRALGIASPERLVPTLVDVYRKHQPQIRLIDDARTAVEALRASCRLACITDGPVASQIAKVRTLELDRWMAPIVPDGIPGCRVSKTARTRLSSGRASIWRCGNPNASMSPTIPRKDFVAPLQLGWQVIRVRHPGALHETVATPPEVPCGAASASQGLPLMDCLPG